MNIPENTIINISCPPGKKIYFASDFHLGAPDRQRSLEREQKIVHWLDTITDDAAHLFLVGDIFDFWFEYKNVIPKGYTRLLGKLATLSDKGLGISVFTGNHDMWMDGYFEEEFNIPVYDEPQLFSIAQKTFLIAHGDGLGPGDSGYKRLKKFLRNKTTRKLFAAVPSSWGLALADRFSKKSRLFTEENTFLGEEKEWLIQYAREELKSKQIDYFIFGHRHLPIDFSLSDSSRMINLGDWLNHYTYAVFDGENMFLKKYQGEDQNL